MYQILWQKNKLKIINYADNFFKNKPVADNNSK